MVAYNRKPDLNSIDVVKAYVQAFNSGDFPALRALFTDGAVIRGVLGWAEVDQALPIWRELHAGMGVTLQIEALVQDQNTVTARYLETGCFKGPFRGLPGIAPTQRVYSVTAMEWFEFEDGRIARRWGARDFDAIKRQVLG